MRAKTIAVTGTGASGKTMFLTSLLWQLREWENSEFRLDNNVRISGFAPSNGRPAPADVFPFDKFQDALVVKREWPAKTKDIQRFSCQFQRNDRARWRSTQRLDLIDLPGERVADAAIAEFDDFGQWSDHLFSHFDSDSEYEAGRRFCSDLEAGSKEPDDILRNYRRVLAEFVRDSKPLVTPSVFLLDRDGSLAPRIGPGQENQLADQRWTGLNESTQFAPLPQAIRDGYPKIAKTMRKHYRKYRKELAQPFFQYLASSHSLIVLVDIPLLLRGSVARFNDTRQTIVDLLSAMSQETALGRRLARTFLGSLPLPVPAAVSIPAANALASLKIRVPRPVRKPTVFSSLNRVALVANKADLVSRDDLKSERLKSLLHQMTNRARELLPNVETESFVCSACVSTRPGSKPHALVGAPLHDNPSQNDYEYPVSPLPETWPRDWKPGEFDFRDVYPKLGSNTLYPPDHYRMDAVFDFVAMA